MVRSDQMSAVADTTINPLRTSSSFEQISVAFWLMLLVIVLRVTGFHLLLVIFMNLVWDIYKCTNCKRVYMFKVEIKIEPIQWFGT